MSVLLRIVRRAFSHTPVLRDAAFVATRPSWPESVPRPAPIDNSGANYDTDWARQPPARVVRLFLVETFTRPLIKLLATPEIVGLDRLERLQGPVVFAANHASHLDTGLMLSCLPLRFRHEAAVGAGADYWFDRRWKSVLSALTMNIVPIERERVGRRSADLAARLIDDGWSFVIYPEGGRTTDGFTRSFRGGAAYLGIRCEVPIVPVHIAGTRQIFGKGAKRLTPGRARVTFGEPLRAQPGERSRDFSLRIEQAVAAAADEGRTDWWSARRRTALGTTPSLQGPPELNGWRKAWVGTPRKERPKRAWPY